MFLIRRNGCAGYGPMVSLPSTVPYLQWVLTNSHLYEIHERKDKQVNKFFPPIPQLSWPYSTDSNAGQVVMAEPPTPTEKSSHLILTANSPEKGPWSPIKLVTHLGGSCDFCFLSSISEERRHSGRTAGWRWVIRWESEKGRNPAEPL